MAIEKLDLILGNLYPEKNGAEFREIQTKINEIIAVVNDLQPTSEFYENSCDAPGPDLGDGPWYCERSEGHEGLHWFPRAEYTSNEDYPETWA